MLTYMWLYGIVSQYMLSFNLTNVKNHCKTKVGSQEERRRKSVG